MDSEKLTVVMVSSSNYNSSLRAIESAVNNSRPPNKIVVGDNGSEDDTYGQLCRYLGAIPTKIDDTTVAWPPRFDTVYRRVPLTILRFQKQNKSSVLNACMKLFLHETSIFAVLDTKFWYSSTAIESAIKVFLQNTYSSCVVSNIIRYLPNGMSEYIIKPSYDANRLFNSYRYDENMFVALSALQRLGSGFDARLDDMFDYDLMLKISRIGMIYHSAEFMYATDMHDLTYDQTARKQLVVKHVQARMLNEKKQKTPK